VAAAPALPARAPLCRAQILVSAGDASGDVCAAELVRALRARRPESQFFGLGGPECERAGVEIVVPQRELAVGGFAELAPELPRVLRAWRALGRALREREPDLALLVDSAGFNLRFARRARRQGASVLYYVCPQVWAWRGYRRRALLRRADRLALTLPFEPAYYAQGGARVSYVGHPLVDRLDARAAELTRERARAALGLAAEAQVAALLPGSRRGELRNGLDLFLAAGSRLRARRPHVQCLLPVAPSLDPAAVAARVRELELEDCVKVLAGSALEALAAADVALVKPGTATLEAALLGTPVVVAGRASVVSAAIARRLLRVNSLVLPNLILGAPVVPELLQEQAQPAALAALLDERLLSAARVDAVRLRTELRTALGDGGAAQSAAELAVELLDERAGA
jgi:lipid-A-disaccharide synthase